MGGGGLWWWWWCCFLRWWWWSGVPEPQESISNPINTKPYKHQNVQPPCADVPLPISYINPKPHQPSTPRAPKCFHAHCPSASGACAFSKRNGASWIWVIKLHCGLKLKLEATGLSQNNLLNPHPAQPPGELHACCCCCCCCSCCCFCCCCCCCCLLLWLLPVAVTAVCCCCPTAALGCAPAPARAPAPAARQHPAANGSGLLVAFRPFSVLCLPAVGTFRSELTVLLLVVEAALALDFRQLCFQLLLPGLGSIGLRSLGFKGLLPAVAGACSAQAGTRGALAPACMQQIGYMDLPV